nr:PAS domain S-box protein [uncultured Desulfobulbus sp.]
MRTHENRDVQSKLEPEEQKDQEVQCYRSLFNNSLEGIFFTTPDGRYLDVNPTLARIYGFSKPECRYHRFRNAGTYRA